MKESASIAAVSSILLFVVSISPPPSSRTVSPKAAPAPRPPGPGFPFDAPSVKIVADSFIIKRLYRKKEPRGGRPRGLRNSVRNVCGRERGLWKSHRRRQTPPDIDF